MAGLINAPSSQQPCRKKYCTYSMREGGTIEERQANLGVVGKSVGSNETPAKGKAKTALFALSASRLSSGQDRKEQVAPLRAAQCGDLGWFECVMYEVPVVVVALYWSLGWGGI